jgi:hypothetical protein
MKPFSARTRISVKAAKNYFLLNQLATPGLGSLLAKCWMAGTGQLILAVTGCALVVAWFVTTMKEAYASFTADAELNPDFLLFKIGTILFLAAWLWALMTSLSLIREARQNEMAESAKPPPLS